MGKTHEQILPSEALPDVGVNSIIFHNGKGFYYTYRDFQLILSPDRMFECVEASCRVTATMTSDPGSPLVDNGSHCHPPDPAYRDKCILLQTIRHRFLSDTSSASTILRELLSSLNEEEIENASDFESVIVDDKPPVDLIKIEPIDPLSDKEDNPFQFEVFGNMETKTWKQFVIVEFIELAEVATVLNSWIRTNENGELECLWPDQNARKAVLSKKNPLPTWDSWKIRVLASCDNFKEALEKEKRAQDTSDLASCAESDSGKGHRVKRPSKRHRIDNSDSEESDDLPSPKLKRPRPITPLSIHSDNTLSTPSSSKHSISFSTPVSTKVSHQEKLEGTSIQTVVETPKEKICSHKEASCKDQLDRMEKTVQLIRREVLDLAVQIARVHPQKMALSSVENVKFESQFPVTTLHDFLLLEESLENEEQVNLMTGFFQRIGGSSVDDCVRRSLVRLLTNEVAVNFSWEGRKGKRALNSLKIVNVLERVLGTLYMGRFTNKAFETRLREWFRQAGTRIFNKTKKSST